MDEDARLRTDFITRNWSHLPASSRLVICQVIDRLLEGYTGSLGLHCRDGGIRSLEYNYQETPRDMEDRG